MTLENSIKFETKLQEVYDLLDDFTSEKIVFNSMEVKSSNKLMLLLRELMENLPRKQNSEGKNEYKERSEQDFKVENHYQMLIKKLAKCNNELYYLEQKIIYPSLLIEVEEFLGVISKRYLFGKQQSVNKSVVFSHFFNTCILGLIPFCLVIGLIQYYFFYPVSIIVDANKTISYKIDRMKMKKPLSIEYLVKSLEGQTPKIILFYDFFDKENKLLSRLTYVLAGETDHFNYVNKNVSGINYVTIIKNDVKLGKKYKIYTKSTYNDCNTAIKHIHAAPMEFDNVDSVTINFQAWFNKDNGKKGNVSAFFFLSENLLSGQ